jgi:hypothetical protein
MMNNGNGTFTDRASSLGVEPPTGGDYQEKQIRGQDAARSSRSAAVADFNGDGRLEIVTNNFNDRPYFFANGFPKKNYLELKRLEPAATATRSDRRSPMDRQDGDGSAGESGGRLSRAVQSEFTSGGDAKQVDSVEVRWPRGVQTLRNPPVNNTLDSGQ